MAKNDDPKSEKPLPKPESPAVKPATKPAAPTAPIHVFAVDEQVEPPKTKN